MDRGLYAASSGGLIGAKRLDIVANNLANANTVGFKAERLVSRQQQFSDTLASQLAGAESRAPKDHDRTPGVVQVASETDFTPGPVSNTGNPLDVALGKANQFFVIATPEGERLTRAGNFTKNSNGTLVTPDGLSVQGDGGEIVLPPGEATITSNGSIIVDKQVVARLRVVEVADLSTLRRTEGVRFQNEAGGSAPVENPSLIPQSVEMPNISVVEAMVEMINAQKAFEAYTKSVRTIDELNERSIRNARLSG